MDHIFRFLRASLAVLSLLAPCSQGSAADLTLTNVHIQVLFSPDGGIQDALIRTIGEAKSLITVQAFTFTNPEIAAALRDAHRRGVDVRVILDKSQLTEKYSVVTFFRHAGIPVWIDSAHQIAHAKTMTFDANTTATGSYNYTVSAEHRNLEHLQIIQSPELARVYIQNWEDHARHSVAVE